MTTTDRNGRRRRHAAQGARWVTAGLAVSGTVGITTYLEVRAAVHDAATAAAATSSESIGIASQVPIPARPQLAPGQAFGDAIGSVPPTSRATAAAPGAPAVPVAPRRPSVTVSGTNVSPSGSRAIPRVTVPRRTVHATTRGSGG